MSDIPGVQTWAYFYVGLVITSVLFVWWLRLFLTERSRVREIEQDVAQRVDGLTQAEYAALQKLMWRGGSTSVDRQHLERVREKTGLVSRDFTGDFSLVHDHADILKDVIKKRPSASRYQLVIWVKRK